MLVSMTKWTVLGVLGTTFAMGMGGGWLLRRTPSATGPALVAMPAPTQDAQASAGTGPSGPTSLIGRPPAPPPTAVRAVPTPGTFFRLGPSDTFSEISKKAYGTTKRIADLQRANPTLDPKNLKSGTLVYVPSGREPVPTPPADTVRSPAGTGRTSAVPPTR